MPSFLSKHNLVFGHLFGQKYFTGSDSFWDLEIFTLTLFATFQGTSVCIVKLIFPSNNKTQKNGF